ncbi:MAG: DUF6273 domain-containing protein [Oscillospiraceae bacterium]|jgi:hypothetical protein|nr:DUF6273 domain-containing protein [Oscillospiraceae bacterium]
MKTKKPTAMLIAAALVAALTACGGGGKDAYVDEPEPRRTATSDAATTEPPPATPGDVIQFGGYDWRVLDAQDGKALIITDKVIESRAYNEEQIEVTWETCDLRAYLNGGFYNSFSAADKAKIVKTRISNRDNQWFNTPGGKDTDDYIFLLSLEEVVKYFGDSGQLNNGDLDDWRINDQYNDDRIAYHVGGTYDGYTKDEGEASSWWLRSPGSNSSSVADVILNGHVYIDGYNVSRDNGVRPAMWVSL